MPPLSSDFYEEKRGKKKSVHNNVHVEIGFIIMYFQKRTFFERKKIFYVSLIIFSIFKVLP